MIVMKFGGTSVGTAPRIQHVAALCASEERPVVVVLSAMAGTTNALLSLCDDLYQHNSASAEERVQALEDKYLAHCRELYSAEQYLSLATTYVREVSALLRQYCTGLFTSYEAKIVVAQGELLSTHLMYYYLQQQGLPVVLLPALDFMRTDVHGEPDEEYIAAHLLPMLTAGSTLYLTQGFLCRNAYGEVDNLLRGGSDYTASLVGAAVHASEIQIWTDIDGMHNNDPRYVAHTTAVHHLHFAEAAELAYFGAKILHPTCVQPAQRANIPVRLLNTMDPSAEGTLIDNTLVRGTIKAVAAKDGLTAIRIRSSRMLLATGFLRKVFEIFEHYNTPIDMLATSEVGVAMSIDDASHLAAIVGELQKYGDVEVEDDMCILCIVGDIDENSVGYAAQVGEALRTIPVHMISYGGSHYNISVLIRREDKATALQSLSNTLFPA